MDNEELDLLPRQEQLARLYELLTKLEGLVHEHGHAAVGASLDHWKEHGHPLRFGCCRDALSASQELDGPDG